MATKRYISTSHISLSVFLPSGKSKRVSFNPITGSGSFFITDDKELQNALEKHYRFGTLFIVDPIYVEQEEQQKAKRKAMDVKVEQKIEEVTITCLDDAKEYLSDRFGISRTKMNSMKAIEEHAKANNIKFIGL